MKILLFFICISIFFEISTANLFQEKKSTQTTDEVVQTALKWLHSIKKNLPDHCIADKKPDVTPEALLVSPVSCSEDGESINRYSFSGKFHKSGKLKGRGILKINPGLPEQSACIRVQNLFGEKIKTIEADFSNGIPKKKAKITWQNGMSGEVILSKGVPHGFYKVFMDNHIWSFGHLENSRALGPCWIGSEDKILLGECRNDIWSLHFHNSSSTFQIFLHDAKVAIAAVPMGETDDDAVVFGQEMLPTSIKRISGCFIMIPGETYGDVFRLNMRTWKRNYLIEKPNYDICANAGPASGGRIVETERDIVTSMVNYFSNLFHISYHSTPMDLKSSRKFLSNVEPLTDDATGKPLTNMFEGIVTIFSPALIEFLYIGEYDKEGNFHGQAILESKTQGACLKAVCTHVDYGRIILEFVHGVVQGTVVVYSSDTSSHKTFLVKDGVIHSLLIEIGLRPIYPTVEDDDEKSNNLKVLMKRNGIAYVANFVNGRQEGPVWLGLVGVPIQGQGFLYGNSDKHGKLTGDNNAYIYPDYYTALVGKFEDNYMKSAQVTRISQIRCQDGILHATFEPVNKSSVAFYYDPPSNESLGTMLLARDPYEQRTIELYESSIPGAGQGIFAVRDIPSSQVAALYNGMVYNQEQKYIRSLACGGHISMEKRKQCHKYRISGYLGALFDIPEEFDDINIYNATLAHKTNNNFGSKANSIFYPMEHPRFGLIVTILSIRPIAKGEEIFVDYGYSVNTIGETDWYFELKEKMAKESEKKKEEHITSSP